MNNIYEYEFSKLNKQMNLLGSVESLKGKPNLILDPEDPNYNEAMDYTKYEKCPTVSQIQGGSSIRSPKTVELHLPFDEFNDYYNSDEGKTFLDFIVIKMMENGVRVCYSENCNACLLEEGILMYDFGYDENELNPFNGDKISPNKINAYYYREAS